MSTNQGANQASVKPQYSMVITWSPLDGVYLVRLPEWMPYLINRNAVTHGATYEDAAKNGREVLEMLIAEYQDAGKPLPDPQLMSV